MRFTLTWLRAVALFYRSLMWFPLALSALLVGSVLPLALQEGWASGLLPRLLLLKWLTLPVVWYLAERSRPHQYWFYFNLSVSRGSLWTGVAAVDTLFFIGMYLILGAGYSAF